MKTVNDVNFEGKKALIRVDFNVPLDENLNITDDTRIQAALPTIQKILADGGAVILMSHLGRPKNGPIEKYSLKPVATHLESILNCPVKFAPNCVGSATENLANNLQPGNVLLLENLRFYSEEMSGDETFAKSLAVLGDVYVNDAFGTAHRAHASTAIIAKFFPIHKVFGLLMAKELNNVEMVMKNPKPPFTAIIGGAKVSSKISIIENLLDKIDNLVIGGGMAYTFIKAQGGTIGNSLVEDDYLEMALKVIRLADEKNVQILLPEDSAIANDFSPTADHSECATKSIPDGWMGMDIGPDAIEKYKTCIENSQTILWNGPMGVFEFDKFEEGTKQAAFAVVRATEAGAYSLVGGGDSVAAVNKYDLKDHVSYVSTGGGALLELIEGKELPGVAAILK
ncbi:MAG: phosphoglycerate kinase [Salibacteraceae bacterium]|jgi:phosphoglycerate kinase